MTWWSESSPISWVDSALFLEVNLIVQHDRSDQSECIVANLFYYQGIPSGQTRRRHQKEKFSSLLAIWAGNSSVTGGFSAQRPVTQSFDVFFDLRLNIRLSKQWQGWGFVTPSCLSWRHCNDCRNDTATDKALTIWICCGKSCSSWGYILNPGNVDKFYDSVKIECWRE